MKKFLVQALSLKSILFLLCLNSVFAVRADPEYLVPPIIIIGYFAVIALMVLMSSIILTWLFRTVLNKFNNENRKKSSLHTLIIFIFIGGYIWAENFNGFLFGAMESTKGEVFYGVVYYATLVFCALAGGVLGYYSCPKQE